MPDAKQHPRKESQPARNLREPDQVTNDRGYVEKSREILRARPTQSAEQNRTTEIKKGSSTKDAQQEDRRNQVAPIEKRENRVSS